jgi:hypothetical protein
LTRVLNCLQLSNFRSSRRFRQPIRKKIRNSKKITATEPKLARFTAILTWSFDLGMEEGWGGGAVLSLSSNAMRRGRQAGRSGNDEERRNSEKRGEWRRERNPDLGPVLLPKIFPLSPVKSNI